MKVITLAFLLLFLQIAAAMVDYTGLYSYNLPTDDNWNQDMQDIVVAGEYVSNPVTGDVSNSLGFGDFIRGFRILRDAIYRVVDVGATLELFGLDSQLAFFFSIPVYMVVIIGIAQFISNRGSQTMR